VIFWGRFFIRNWGEERITPRELSTTIRYAHPKSLQEYFKRIGNIPDYHTGGFKFTDLDIMSVLTYHLWNDTINLSSGFMAI
jgi:hypothetical protein